jgi:hypothetical protein
MSTYLVFDMFGSIGGDNRGAHKRAREPLSDVRNLAVCDPNAAGDVRESPSDSSLSTSTPLAKRHHAQLNNHMLVLLAVRRVHPWLRHVVDEHAIVTATWRLLASVTTAMPVPWQPGVIDIGAALWMVLKIVHQRHPTATHMAAIMGLTRADILRVELAMCKLLDWNVMAAAGLMNVQNCENDSTRANT